MPDNGDGNGSDESPQKTPETPPKKKPEAPDNVEFREGEQPERSPKTEEGGD